jgi:LPXTG-motif cell wall-anchored protein
MCGCSSNFVEDEGLNFSGNRPSVVEVGEGSSFDFTGNRPSVVEVGEGSSFDFMGDLDGKTQFDDFLGKKAKARRQERRALKKGESTDTGAGAGAGGGDTRAEDVDKNAYGTSSWFSNNWIYLVIGVAVIGGGYYFYKKRK